MQKKINLARGTIMKIRCLDKKTALLMQTVIVFA